MMGHPRDRRKTLTVSAVVSVVFDGLDIGNKLYLIQTSQDLYTFCLLAVHFRISYDQADIVSGPLKTIIA
jgi:hypothetical protein